MCLTQVGIGLQTEPSFDLGLKSWMQSMLTGDFIKGASGCLWLLDLQAIGVLHALHGICAMPVSKSNQCR